MVGFGAGTILWIAYGVWLAITHALTGGGLSLALLSTPTPTAVMAAVIETTAWRVADFDTNYEIALPATAAAAATAAAGGGSASGRPIPVPGNTPRVTGSDKPPAKPVGKPNAKAAPPPPPPQPPAAASKAAASSASASASSSASATASAASVGPLPQRVVLDMGSIAIGEARVHTLQLTNTHTVAIAVVAPLSSDATVVTGSLWVPPAVAKATTLPPPPAAAAGAGASAAAKSNSAAAPAAAAGKPAGYNAKANDRASAKSDDTIRPPAGQKRLYLSKSPIAESATAESALLLAAASSGAGPRKSGLVEVERVVLEPGQSVSLVIGVYYPMHAAMHLASLATSARPDTPIPGSALLNVSSSLPHATLQVQVLYVSVPGQFLFEPVNFGPVFPGLVAHRTLYAQNLYQVSIHLLSLASPDPRISAVLTNSLLAPGERAEIGSITFDQSRGPPTDNYLSALHWNPIPAAKSATAAAAAAAKSATGKKSSQNGTDSAAGSGANAVVGALLDMDDNLARTNSQLTWCRMAASGLTHVLTNLTVFSNVFRSISVQVEATLYEPSILSPPPTDVEPLSAAEMEAAARVGSDGSLVRLIVDSTTINFGSVVVNTSKSVYVHVYNPSDSYVVMQLVSAVSAVAFEPKSKRARKASRLSFPAHNSAFFSIEKAASAKGAHTPLSLPPHEAGILGPIVFTPQFGAEASARFYVKNNLTRVAELWLTGTGASGKLEIVTAIQGDELDVVAPLRDRRAQHDYAGFRHPVSAKNNLMFDITPRVWALNLKLNTSLNEASGTSWFGGGTALPPPTRDARYADFTYRGGDINVVAANIIVSNPIGLHNAGSAPIIVSNISIHDPSNPNAPVAYPCILNATSKAVTAAPKYANGAGTVYSLPACNLLPLTIPVGMLQHTRLVYQFEMHHTTPPTGVRRFDFHTNWGVYPLAVEAALDRLYVKQWSTLPAHRHALAASTVGSSAAAASTSFSLAWLYIPCVAVAIVSLAFFVYRFIQQQNRDIRAAALSHRRGNKPTKAAPAATARAAAEDLLDVTNLPALTTSIPPSPSPPLPPSSHDATAAPSSPEGGNGSGAPDTPSSALSPASGGSGGGEASMRRRKGAGERRVSFTIHGRTLLPGQDPVGSGASKKKREKSKHAASAAALVAATTDDAVPAPVAESVSSIAHLTSPTASDADADDSSTSSQPLTRMERRRRAKAVQERNSAKSRPAASTDAADSGADTPSEPELPASPAYSGPVVSEPTPVPIATTATRKKKKSAPAPAPAPAAAPVPEPTTPDVVIVDHDSAVVTPTGSTPTSVLSPVAVKDELTGDDWQLIATKKDKLTTKQQNRKKTAAAAAAAAHAVASPTDASASATASAASAQSTTELDAAAARAIALALISSGMSSTASAASQAPAARDEYDPGATYVLTTNTGPAAPAPAAAVVKAQQQQQKVVMPSIISRKSKNGAKPSDAGATAAPPAVAAPVPAAVASVWGKAADATSANNTKPQATAVESKPATAAPAPVAVVPATAITAKRADEPTAPAPSVAAPVVELSTRKPVEAAAPARAAETAAPPTADPAAVVAAPAASKRKSRRPKIRDPITGEAAPPSVGIIPPPKVPPATVVPAPAPTVPAAVEAPAAARAVKVSIATAHTTGTDIVPEEAGSSIPTVTLTAVGSTTAEPIPVLYGHTNSRTSGNVPHNRHHGREHRNRDRNDRAWRAASTIDEDASESSGSSASASAASSTDVSPSGAADALVPPHVLASSRSAPAQWTVSPPAASTDASKAAPVVLLPPVVSVSPPTSTSGTRRSGQSSGTGSTAGTAAPVILLPSVTSGTTSSLKLAPTAKPLRKSLQRHQHTLAPGTASPLDGSRSGSASNSPSATPKERSPLLSPLVATVRLDSLQLSGAQSTAQPSHPPPRNSSARQHMPPASTTTTTTAAGTALAPVANIPPQPPAGMQATYQGPPVAPLRRSRLATNTTTIGADGLPVSVSATLRLGTGSDTAPAQPQQSQAQPHSPQPPARRRAAPTEDDLDMSFITPDLSFLSSPAAGDGQSRSPSFTSAAPNANPQPAALPPTTVALPLIPGARTLGTHHVRSSHDSHSHRRHHHSSSSHGNTHAPYPYRYEPASSGASSGDESGGSGAPVLELSAAQRQRLMEQHQHQLMYQQKQLQQNSQPITTHSHHQQPQQAAYRQPHASHSQHGAIPATAGAKHHSSLHSAHSSSHASYPPVTHSQHSQQQPSSQSSRHHQSHTSDGGHYSSQAPGHHQPHFSSSSQRRRSPPPPAPYRSSGSGGGSSGPAAEYSYYQPRGGYEQPAIDRQYSGDDPLPSEHYYRSESPPPQQLQHQQHQHQPQQQSQQPQMQAQRQHHSSHHHSSHSTSAASLPQQHSTGSSGGHAGGGSGTDAAVHAQHNAAFTNLMSLFHTQNETLLSSSAVVTAAAAAGAGGAASHTNSHSHAQAAVDWSAAGTGNGNGSGTSSFAAVRRTSRSPSPPPAARQFALPAAQTGEDEEFGAGATLLPDGLLDAD